MDDLPPIIKAQYEAGAPVPRAADHNNDFYGTSKYMESGNPLFQRDRRNVMNEGINVRGTVAANLLPFKGMTITSRLGYRISQSNYHNFETPYWMTAMAILINIPLKHMPTTASTTSGKTLPTI